MKMRMKKVTGILLSLMLVVSLFPVMSAAVPEDPSLTPIGQVEVTNVNTALTPGVRPVFTAQIGAGSDMASVKEEVWTDENDRFMISSLVTNDWVVIAGHTYSYGITLEPKEGYVFDENTKLIYNGKTYTQKEIGSVVKVNGSGLELWDFQEDVDVYGDAIDLITVDLKKGEAVLNAPRSQAVKDTLLTAAETGEIGMNTGTGEVDLEKDGSYDFKMVYDEAEKTCTITVLTETISWKKDPNWTASEETISALNEKGTSPYVKTIAFKVYPASKAYDLDLTEGSVTVKDEDLNCLINALLADDEAGVINCKQDTNTYDFDLDKDGAADFRMVTNDEGTSAEITALESDFAEEKAVLDTPLAQSIAMAALDQPFFTQVTVYFKEKEPARDLGSCTVDLSKGITTKNKDEWEGILASLNGLNFTKKIKTKKDGDKTLIDLDKDGHNDVTVELKTDGGAVLTFDEENSRMKKDASFTLGNPEISAINTFDRKTYYKELVFKIPQEKLPFVDVAESDYFYEAVKWALHESITKGTDDTHFSPEQACTRAQVVTFLWRGAGSPEPSASTNPFSDVKAEDYFYKAVLWAVEKNITKGMSETEFAPESPCTRAQVVTFLHRYEETPAPGSITNPFTDVAASDYFYNAVLWAVDKNITKGMTETTFEPNLSCTRAQIVTFLYRDMGTE
ncbi:MAG: S-layer homology domain-containing protein [Firmicutes bacterium]|nr:S-layer homology domain-containing protein [Bacillota bacterium]